MQVADTASNVNVLTDQTFKITVRRKKNPGPITHPVLAEGASLTMRVSFLNCGYGWCLFMNVTKFYILNRYEVRTFQFTADGFLIDVCDFKS